MSDDEGFPSSQKAIYWDRDLEWRRTHVPIRISTWSGSKATHEDRSTVTRRVIQSAIFTQLFGHEGANTLRNLDGSAHDNPSVARIRAMSGGEEEVEGHKELQMLQHW